MPNIDLKRTFRILTYNIGTLIFFEIIYKVLSIVIFRTLFVQLLNLILKISGYNYLTLENIIPFLLRPWNLALMIAFFFLMGLYSLFDLSTVIVILDISRQEKKIGLINAMKVSLKRSVRVFQPGNLVMLIVLLFMMPFLSLGTGAALISSVGFPQFIQDYISETLWVLILVAIGVFLLFWLLIKWVFAFNYFIIEGDGNFRGARRKSKRLARGRKIGIFFVLLAMNLIHMGLYSLTLRISIAVLIWVYGLLESVAVSIVLSTSVWLLIMTVFAIFEALATPVTYAVIGLMYYHRQRTLGDEIRHIDYDPEKGKKREVSKRKGFVIVMGILVAAFLVGIALGRYTPKVSYVRTVEVTAHRGASSAAPENTMVAFEAAKELGADWIELDIRQTKDGVLVVSHDANVKRITGVSKVISSSTFEELRELDFGSYFSKEFEGEKIPSLKEVITWAKENDMRLIIEIRSSNDEYDTEQDLINMIREEDFVESCIVSTQNYTICEEIKEKDPEITTLYVMTLGFGDVLTMEAADAFGVETTSLNENLVSRLHKAGKELFVWTVNSASEVVDVVNAGADNIMTDDVATAIDAVYEGRTSDVLNAYIKYLKSLIKY